MFFFVLGMLVLVSLIISGMVFGYQCFFPSWLVAKSAWRGLFHGFKSFSNYGVSFCEVFVNMWCWMHWIISLILIFVFLVICLDWIELIDINFLSRLFYLFLLFCLSWLSRFKCNLTLIRLPLSGMCDLMSHASETYKLQWSWSSVEGCGNDNFSCVMETNNISGFWW